MRFWRACRARAGRRLAVWLPPHPRGQTVKAASGLLRPGKCTSSRTNTAGRKDEPVNHAHPDPAMLRAQPKRTGGDHWSTPACLVTVLCNVVVPLLPTGVLFCPGDTHAGLSGALRKAGRKVVCDDLPDHDFLVDPLPAVHAPYASIVFNPPFNKIDAFLERALAFVDQGATASAVALLRMDHPDRKISGATFNRAAHIIAMNWRPYLLAEDTFAPRFAFRWLVWRTDQPGPPKTIFLAQPEYA